MVTGDASEDEYLAYLNATFTGSTRTCVPSEPCGACDFCDDGPAAVPEREFGLDVVSWPDLFAGVLHEDAVVDGLAFRGRWTSLVAPAKAGKSTLVLSVTTAVARGWEPFDGTARKPVDVLLCDAE